MITDAHHLIKQFFMEEDKSYEEIQSALKRFAERNIKFRRENKPLLQRPICDTITFSSTPAAGGYTSPVLA